MKVEFISVYRDFQILYEMYVECEQNHVDHGSRSKSVRRVGNQHCYGRLYAYLLNYIHQYTYIDRILDENT